ncbi:hypothetical protein JCM19238_4659 [Vibrio ponticus]|nr:hypothetical protein JCM19238_4659 [Vibrio ponticus]
MKPSLSWLLMLSPTAMAAPAAPSSQLDWATTFGSLLFVIALILFWLGYSNVCEYLLLPIKKDLVWYDKSP